MPGNEGVDRQSLGVRAAAMARVNWSVNIESAFRVNPTKGGRLRQSESVAQKGACIDSDFRGDCGCQTRFLPGFAGHRPAFHGGFCVSRWAISPWPAQCRRNYQSVVICADSSSRKAPVLLCFWPFDALNPRGPEAARRYTYPNRPAVRFDVSAGINA